MMMTNFTANPTHKSFIEHYCSTELEEGGINELIVLLVLNIFLSVTAFLGNALILAALQKASSLHLPSKLLFRIASTARFWNGHIKVWGSCISILLCLVTSVISYAKIFFTLRRRDQVQAQGQQTQNVLLNRARYKKPVNSALWVQLPLVLCYLPSFFILVLLLRRGVSPSLVVANSFTVTLVFLNSSLNPLLYCWKIREVRQAVKDIVKGLFCSSS